MRNKSVESISGLSCRSKPRCNARLIQSSQIPIDFFSSHKSTKTFRKRAREGEVKEIYQEFESVLQMRRNLKSLALKLSTKTEAMESIEMWTADKENIEVKFPSLHINVKSSQEKFGKTHKKKNSAV